MLSILIPEVSHKSIKPLCAVVLPQENLQRIYVVRVLEPVFEPTFIFDSYATRKGKGTHRAVKRAQKFMRSGFHYYKADIRKYFDSVDHDVLLGLVRRKIKDEKVLKLVEQIIRNSDVSRGLVCGKGLPVGNLTSQFFANVVSSETWKNFQARFILLLIFSEKSIMSVKSKK